MSRIGIKPISIPSGVETTINNDGVTVKGPKGTLTSQFHPDMKVLQDQDELKVERPSDEPNHRALHGLTRSLLANMVIGVSEGYSKTLDLVGVGYRAEQNGDGITLQVMFSHPVIVNPTRGVTIEVEGANRIHVRGTNKQAVGHIAAQIRKVRPPNVYTGKGIRYADENVRIKPGKSARRVV